MTMTATATTEARHRQTAAPRTLGAPARRSAPWGGEPPADLTREATRQRRLELERHLRSLAGIVAQSCVEAELGLRPARQLAAWLDLETYGKLSRRADLAERIRTDSSPRTSPRTIQARCCAVTDTVYEASATVHCGDRVRALALRIERRRHRWKVTAVEMG